MSVVFGPDEAWREMRLHMDWSERLSLVFLFADSASALQPIRQWTDDAWQWRTAPVRRIAPDQAATATLQVMQGLQAHFDAMRNTRAPVWVELLAQSSADQNWDAARAQTLARLNEAREWLTSSFKRPLVLCLPRASLAEVGHVAPDLWHVRSFVAVVQVPLTPALAFEVSTTTVDSIQAHAALQLQPLRDAVVEAKAHYERQPSTAGLRQWWDAQDDLCAALLDCGALTEALAASTTGIELARRLRKEVGDGPQVLRDLSVSLDKVGKAESAAGRGEAALAAYRESLEICRELRRALGDGPQVLRDLSVSLNKVGDAESAAGRGEAALTAYRESLEIRRQLRQALGDGPQVLDDLAGSLERIAALHEVPNLERQQAIEEALELRRRLRSALPEVGRHADRLRVAEQIAASLPASVPG